MGVIMARSGGGAPELRERVRRRLGRWCREGFGPGVVVGVSGGCDSVALLRLLHEVAAEPGLALSVAHLNHGVRGAAGEADARFVGSLAAGLGLPFDLGAWVPSRSGHFEADARAARYAWLAEVARGRGATAVAVGHTRDDQAETILHRVVRGTGLRGLAGMSARRPLAPEIALVRPLLDVGRAELRSYLAELDQPWREDASNADLSRTRARARHDLLPKLAAEYNPRVVEALARLGRLAGAYQGHLSADVERWADAAIVGQAEGEVVLRVATLRGLGPVVRGEVVRAVWRRMGWAEGGMSSARWLRLARRVVGSSGRWSVGEGIDVTRIDGLVRLARARPERELANTEARRVLVPGSVSWGRGRVILSREATGPDDERIDLDALRSWSVGSGQAALELRAPRAGDRFGPLGLGGHSQPLADFLRSRKLSRAERAGVPLLCDREGIVWVVGHRIAERVKLTERTERALGLRWELDGGHATEIFEGKGPNDA